MNFDQNYWQNRYQNDLTGWDLGHVSRPLKFIIDNLSNKQISILIPGAGNAYEALYLLQLGFKDITVLDIAQQPLKLLSQKIRDTSSLKIIHEDFFNHTGAYDLILEQTFFCALHPHLRSKYVSMVHELLKTGGQLEGVLFNFNGIRESPPFTSSEKEYKELFQEKFDTIQLEKCSNSEDSRKNKELIIKIIKNGK